MTATANSSRGARSNRMRRTVAALLLGTTVLTGPLMIARGASAQDAAPQTQVQAVNPMVSFADLAERVSPAVVNISTTQEVKPPPQRRGGPPGLPMFPPGSPFEEFFRQFQSPFGEDGGPEQGPPAQRGGALGSGFVIDAAGLVVTNNHVIDGADGITVTLQDGTTLPATLVGRDVKTDIALLRVKSEKPLPALEWGDSDGARVGDWVMAVGNPFGLGGTVTKGIISARGRDIHSGPYDDYLQLDAAINRGNSGGPTFGLDGRVLGINTAIYSPNGGSVGIGFAIPANIARTVVEQLKATGKVERGWLGVMIQGLTPELAESVGLDHAKGVLVADVSADSPAAKGGLRQGDVILSFDGKPVENARDLTRRVAAVKTGQAVDVNVLRGDKQSDFKITVEAMPETDQVAEADEAGKGAQEKADPQAVKGLQLAALDAQVRKRLGVPDNVSGVLVTGLAEDAGEMSVRPGDIILRIADQAVKTPADVNSAVGAAEKAGRKSVLLLVNRRGAESFVALRLGKS